MNFFKRRKKTHTRKNMKWTIKEPAVNLCLFELSIINYNYNLEKKKYEKQSNKYHEYKTDANRKFQENELHAIPIGRCFSFEWTWVDFQMAHWWTFTPAKWLFVFFRRIDWFKLFVLVSQRWWIFHSLLLSISDP